MNKIKYVPEGIFISDHNSLGETTQNKFFKSHKTERYESKSFFAEISEVLLNSNFIENQFLCVDYVLTDVCKL